MGGFESGGIVGNRQRQEPCRNHRQHLRSSTLKQPRPPGTPAKGLLLIRKNDTTHSTALRQGHFERLAHPDNGSSSRSGKWRPSLFAPGPTGPGPMAKRSAMASGRLRQHQDPAGRVGPSGLTPWPSDLARSATPGFLAIWRSLTLESARWPSVDPALSSARPWCLLNKLGANHN